MKLTRVVWFTTIVVTVFSALSAVGGGIAVLATNGIGMPTSMLDGSPFDSFLWPGVILLVVIGGTQVVAAVQLLRRHPSALAWTAVAGFAMIIWITVETAIIGGFSVLQGIYLATGIAQVACVVALLGVVGWLPRAPWGAPAVR